MAVGASAAGPGPGRATLLGVVAGGLLGAWGPLEGLAIWWQIRGAEAAGLLAAPQPWFDGPALGVVAVLAALATRALVRRVPADRSYRLLPMAGVVVVFAKLFLLPDVVPPAYLGSPDALVATTASAVVEAARAAAGPEGLPADVAPLQEIARANGRPPFLHRGVSVAAWQVKLVTPCDGPHGDRGDDPPGTIYYCLAPDRRRAWVSAVGLPRMAGTPDLLRGDDGRPVAAEIEAPAPGHREYDGDQEGGGPLPPGEPTGP